MTLPDLQLDERYGDVGAGWQEILVVLHRHLVVTDPLYRLVAIKPRFGGIKIEIETQRDLTTFERNVLATLVSTAEEATYYTCELCGEEGKARAIPRKQARIGQVIRCERCFTT